MIRRLISSVPFFILLVALALPLSAADTKKKTPRPEPPPLPTDQTILKTLRVAHPRLMLTEDRLAELKKTVQSDPDAAAMYKHLLRAADECLTKKPLEHKLVGPRLLQVSRDCLNRVYSLGLAWRLTGKSPYARRCIQDLLTVCEFPDWNPSHFLDTAEMSHAVGVGYDWLYDQLTPAQREKIRLALGRLGLDEGLKVYRRGGWWAASNHNWNQVCNAGMMIGSLALADTDPAYAQAILPAAAKSMPLALATYAPDGAWPEGPGYWNYATSYTCYALAALETALGTDLGLSKGPGLSVTGFFPIYAAGPTGLFFNYADSGERARRRPAACLFYLARKYNQPFLAWNEHELIRRQNSSHALHLVWYVPQPKSPGLQLDLDKQFRGPVELALFRSSWKDDALFAAVKAGYNQVNHSHLDLGSFEMDALGVRWARDLGSDDYNLPGYWSSGRGGKRWSYYRLGSLSHNLPLLDGQQQDPLAHSRMTLFRTAPDAACAVVDFSSAYPQASRAHRGLALVQDRRSLLVQDEFTLPKPCQVAWGMTTDADIKTDGPAATLSLQGRQVQARILEPPGAAFEIESAQREPPEHTNKGVRRLVIHLRDRQGPLRIAILLSPVWPGAAPERKLDVRPLENW